MTEKLEKWEKVMKERVAAFDIDGVLNNYPQSWLDFINANNEFPIHDLRDAKKLLSYQRYKELKQAYRKAGEQASVASEASLVTAELKSLGFKIVLITLRPFELYDNLYKDTIHWLEDNKITYDSVIGDKNKHIRILHEYPLLSFMVEDHRFIANLVAHWGYKVYLKENIYNIGYVEKGVIRIKRLREVLKNETSNL